jgi:acyl-CoA synthetase (AMP-forming)/AMP-acid ligase II
VPITPPDVAAPETLPRWLYQLAERYGDAEALVEPAGEVRTFGELGRRVTALSETLAKAGVRRGGRVAYLLPNSAFIIEQFLAATRLGAVSLGINTRSRLHDLRTVLRRAQPDHLIAARSFLSIDFEAMISEALDGLEHRPAVLWSDRLDCAPRRDPGLPDCAQASDLAVAFMTSGTTGAPKLPAHTHQHVVAHLRAAGKAARVDRGATSLLVLPFCGTFGFVSAMSTLRIAEAGDPAEASAAMGEIQFRGPSVPDAYLQADGTLSPALTDDGWFSTGDLGHLDEDGGFTYVARKDDALRLAGFLVDPAEIERFPGAQPGRDAGTGRRCRQGRRP